MACNHLAIIMDGNGRWAQARGLARPWGHRQGARQVDEILTACGDLGIRYLSLYAFSTENWNRPAMEVHLLMRLLVHQLRRMDKKLVREKVALVAQGSLERLPDFARAELLRVMEVTAIPSPRVTLNLCLSYGGRQEIVEAARDLAERVRDGKMTSAEISESSFANSLYQPEIPDPDLLIRTGGEYRVSNFMLWQIAYTEFLVTDTLWPDFGRAHLIEALDEFEHRERRFGKTTEQVRSERPEAKP